MQALLALMQCCSSMLGPGPEISSVQIAMIKLAFLLMLAFASSGHAIRTAADDSNNARVDVDLFVMSKCPDAVFAEEVLAPVFEELKDIISLNLHFIGFKENDTYVCKHGVAECNGNIQQLCVQLNSPVPRRYDWAYRFALCNNQQGLPAVGTFMTAAKCLKETRIPLAAATKMLGCMYGPTHDQLLQQELRNTALLGVQTSATIQVDGNTICVRDGGAWKDCPAGSEAKDFKTIICGTYASKTKGRLPPVCKQTPQTTAAVA